MGTNPFNGDIKKKMILLTLALFVLVCYIVYKMPGGCHGTCQQGRKPCDCKDKQ
jgi:hypothetical protein